FDSEQTQIAKLTSAIIPDSSVVFDRNGEKIGEYYNFYHIFVPYDQIPKPMIDALLAIEDRKFFEHSGVNWKSMGRAILSTLTSGRFAQGGSTLTMQLVKNYLLTREKKVSRKVRELILSYYVEKNLSKERILELYLNTMYMGHGAYGIGAASQTYFGKNIQSLGVSEFALLAGLFQAPSAYDPHKNPELALKRRRVVLDAMVAAKYLSSDNAKDLKSQQIEFKPWISLNQSVAPYFLSWIRQQVSEKLGDEGDTINDVGYKIYTTLDKKLQLKANTAIDAANTRLEAIQAGMKLKKGDRLEAALVAIDPKTGAVLAMNGGRSFKASQFNRAVAAKRSPGSSFKPIVYSIALEKGMTWSDMVFVSPLNLGGYKPKNHDGDDLTEVTLIKALAKSMNTPVISLAQKYGIDAIRDRALSMGVESPMPREIGIAIGGFSSSILDVARIYSTIANDGSLLPTWSLKKISDRNDKILFDASTIPREAKQVFSPSISSQLRSGLQAVLSYGTGASASHLALSTAGKTGTSDDSRDNWFCGFSRNLVAVTWVGTDGNAPLGKASSGASLALPTWAEFMSSASDTDFAPSTWPTNADLVSVTIDPDYGTPTDQGGITALFPRNKIPKANQASEDMKSIQQDGTQYRKMKIDD
ncbi:MAG: PBP1A family penicillin-binding protein, partial [Proteobacteria bacterium]|nr:PBP1A family penicillin-binding protein [Pseudomonadota bacterium]